MKLDDLLEIKYHKTKNNCYTLAREVFKRYGIEIPDLVVNADNRLAVFKAIRSQYNNWRKIKEPIEPCLVAISNNGMYIDHIGVYIGQGRFIHQTNEGVFISKIKEYKNVIRGFYERY